MNADSPTPFDALFIALEGKLKVPMLKGTSSDAAGSAERRVIWIRDGGLGTENCPYQLPGVKVISRRVHPWTATVYGASDLDVCQLVDQLEVQLEAIIGPRQGIDDVRTGYRFAAGKVEPMGDDDAAEIYVCDVAITLFTLTIAEARPLAPARASLATTPQSPEALTGSALTIL